MIEPMLACVESYVTLGEVCTELESTFGRYQPPEGF